jgi:dolichol-phosphate mannosyltransferase
MKYKYSVVIPTFNEKENIEELISRIEQLLSADNYQIIVADDNSPDNTWEIVGKLAEKNSRISCIRRVGKERGLSPSIIDGFNQAKGEIFAVIDGDLQHDESFLPKMLKLGEDYDIVLGTRHADGGEIEGGWPLSRKLASSIATFAAKIILGISVSDPMSGYFVMKREIYEKIKDKMNPKGFKIFLEVLFWSKKYCSNLRVKESGINFRPRTAGKSKLGAKVIWEYFSALLQMRFSRQ